MSSTSVQISHTSSMGIYVSPQQCNIWREVAEGNSSSPTDASTVLKIQAQLQTKYVYPSHLQTELSDNEQHSSWLTGRIEKRLAQNREAAKKSRLKKKAYVQELEVSRLKLAQLEQELEQVKRNQGTYVGDSLHSNSRPIRKINPGIPSFEIEYARWTEEQQRQKRQLQIALQANASDADLRILVEDCLNHYDTLFLIKSENAKADVFYLMSGLWRTPVERFFHWIGGYRPSELLNVIMPQIQPLSERQAAHVNKLKQSTLQAEYALSQGLEKLQQSLGEILLPDGTSQEMFEAQMTLALQKLEAIEGFVTQADHLRKQSLQLMSRILTPSQAAMGLLALGDYFNRLSALSTLWEARPTKNRAI